MSVRPPDAFVFMKVGQHAGEDFDQILERKNREYAAAGQIFWGYGGTTLHPTRHVQPFVRLHLSEQGGIYLLMEPISSRADPDLLPAQEFSADGVHWEPIPSGVSVTGSRYALILGEIKPGDLEIPLDDYVVGVGPSRGKEASSYLRGHVDKGCFSRAESGSGDSGDARITRFVAELQKPYAVLLR